MPSEIRNAGREPGIFLGLVAIDEWCATPPHVHAFQISWNVRLAWMYRQAE